jgi:glycerophosphoryl diester phosphodiesterase
MKSEIIMMIHNGGGGTGLNTKEYLEWASSSKPDFIEVDVRCTSDMVAVLHHDPFIIYKGEKFIIENITYNDLKKYLPAILRLDNTVDFINSFSIGINFDIKELRAVDSVIKILEEKNMADNLIFSGCRIDEIRKIHNFNKELPVLLNAEPAPVTPEEYKIFIRETIDTVKNECFYGLNIDFNDCRQELIELAEKESVPIMVWTVDNIEDMKRFRDLNVYSITTNEIILLGEVLKNNQEGRNGNSIS